MTLYLDNGNNSNKCSVHTIDCKNKTTFCRSLHNKPKKIDLLSVN